MDQEVTYQRTEKVSDPRAGGGTIEGFKTRILKTIHYETRVISTNYGPLGLKDTIDPDDARKALVERSWAAIVHPNQEASKAEDAQFKHDMTTIELKIRINQLRVVAGLCAYVLVFIKELPFCRPNLRFAMRITDEWDRIFREEYDIPTATDRKKIKLRMLFDLFAVESAVVEKFFACMESSVEFEDMRPNDDGTLKEWDITQLADVVHNLQRHLDMENILNAWSHNIDHIPACTAIAFHLKTVLAQMHGDAIDLRRLRTSAAPVQSAGRLPFGTNEGDPTVQPAQQGAAPSAPGLQFKQIITEGLTRSDCSELGGQLSARRQLRNKMSHALVDSAAGSAARARPGETETKRFERIVSTNASLRQVHLPNTKQPVELSPAAVAGSHLPTLDEVLNSGVPQNLLDYALGGLNSSVSNLGLDHNLAMIGMSSKARWEYKKVKNSAYPGPVDWDFGWARFKPPVKGKAQPVTTDLPDAVGPGAAPQAQSSAVTTVAGTPIGGGGQGKSVWMRAALQVMAESNNGEVFSMPKDKNVTAAIYRDVIASLADANDRSNLVRVPKRRDDDFNRIRALHSDYSPIDGQPQGKPVDPSVINPDCMYDQGQRVLSEKYMTPAQNQRIGCGVPHEDNVYQRRLDLLNDNCALPTCVRPQQFAMSPPIEEDKEGGGIYFNKWVSGGHAAWVVEIAAMLKNVPGLSGCHTLLTPDSLMVGSARSRQSGAQDDPMTDIDGESWRDPVRRPGEDDAREAADQTPMPSSMAAQVSSPHAGEASSSASSLRPTSEEARAKAEAAPLRQNAAIDSMYYEWDMQATALTIIANDMFHFDCEEEFDAAIDNYPDVFTIDPNAVPGVARKELLARMLRDRPQHSLRFPARPGNANILVPLTRAPPLDASRFVVANKSDANAELSMRQQYQLLQQESLAEGCPLSFTSMQYANAESKLKNTNDLDELTGNLFARSTWLLFTNKQLDARGHLTDDEQARLCDHGLYIRLQVRNARASNPDGPGQAYSKHIGKVPKARLTSMEAQERMTISYADDTAAGGEEYGDLHRERRRMLAQQQKNIMSGGEAIAAACKRRREAGLKPKRDPKLARF